MIVTIAGRCKSGKSTVAEIIRLALVDYGINCVVNDVEEDDVLSDGHFQDRVVSLSQMPHNNPIHINVVQINRDTINKESE